MVHFLIPLCLLARIGDLVLRLQRSHFDAVIMPVDHQDWLEMLTSSLPVYLFFTTYILVCLSWFYLFKKSFTNSPDLFWEIMKLYLVVNAFVYSFYTAFVILMCFPAWQLAVHIIETFFAMAISLLTGLAFAFYGSQLFSHMHMNSVFAINPSKLVVAQKVRYTAVICTLVFFLRAFMIVASFFFLQSAVEMIFDNIFWFTFVEILPCLSVLAILGRTAPKTKAPRHETKPLLTNQ